MSATVNWHWFLCMTFWNACSIFISNRDVMYLSGNQYSLRIPSVGDRYTLVEDRKSLCRGPVPLLKDWYCPSNTCSFTWMDWIVKYWIGWWITVSQSKSLGHYLYHWSVDTIMYVYFHNVCTTILLFKPLGTRASCWSSWSVREVTE